MARPRDRDEEFTAFVAVSSTRLLRLCHLLTGSACDADDLLQASLLKTYLNWGRIRDVEAAEGYARRVIARTHVSIWRKSGRRELPSDQIELPSVAAADLSERDEMWRALQQLGERQRTVLVLRFYEDLTEAQIADAMGTTVGTVKSQLSRGLDNLRPVLDASRATMNGASR